MYIYTQLITSPPLHHLVRPLQRQPHRGAVEEELAQLASEVHK